MLITCPESLRENKRLAVELAMWNMTPPTLHYHSTGLCQQIEVFVRRNFDHKIKKKSHTTCLCTCPVQTSYTFYTDGRRSQIDAAVFCSSCCCLSLSYSVAASSQSGAQYHLLHLPLYVEKKTCVFNRCFQCVTMKVILLVLLTLSRRLL